MTFGTVELLLFLILIVLIAGLPYWRRQGSRELITSIRGIPVGDKDTAMGLMENIHMIVLCGILLMVILIMSGYNG